MKTIAMKSAFVMSAAGIAIIIAAALNSCAGLKVISEYGTAETDAKGNVVITPVAKPIVLPRSEK